MSTLFWRYGHIVCRYPAVFILVPVLLFGGLGFGIFVLDTETDTEKLYFPRGSRAAKDRSRLNELFPNLNNESYSPYAQHTYQKFLRLVFEVRDASDSIFSQQVRAEILQVLQRVQNVVTKEDGSLKDVCARLDKKCVVIGDEYLTEDFIGLVKAGLITYPHWKTAEGQLIDISRNLADAFTKPVYKSNNILVRARVLMVSFILYKDTSWSDTAVLMIRNSVTTKFTESVRIQMLLYVVLFKYGE